MNPTKSLSQTLRVPRIAVLAGLALLGMNAANAQVSQTPLSAGRTVPGNLFLVPSVEWPTLDSMANVEPNYTTARAFPGYFDPEKCYRYRYSVIEGDRYFQPNSNAVNRTCSPANVEWSGNFLNWAATQTIDPFRKALTGGYRVLDTATETRLEKARSDANTGAGIYPDRNLGTAVLVAGAMPSDWASATTRVRTFGNKMRFRGPGAVAPAVTAGLNGTAVEFNPAIHSLTSASSNIVFEVSVRVSVCEPTFLEANCVSYSGNYKPEGLIQEYSRRIRFSAFGFLNDHAVLRDGGVLRARQKFVGPQKLDPATQLWVANANREWNTDGILRRNPDPVDATDTAGVVGTTTALRSYATGTTDLQAKTITDSGVINYINRFGQMTSKNHKTFDPVSELYYTALRYMRGMDNIPAYTNLTGDSDNMYDFADGFPVITDWNGPANDQDPIQYRCQKNAFLGIGDTNSHKDKNLPGHSANSGYTTNDTNAEPTDTATDPINVFVATQKVATNEGITINTNSAFTGRENSAYIAGLAYHAHTKDMRPDLEGTQTVSTHWVDVRENQVLQGRASNQYWLAAKYGGFNVPETVAPNPPFDPYAATVTIPQAAWTDGDVLENGDLRPRNFYVASDADKMISSLTEAFKNIAQENLGSSASLAANSTRLDTSTRTFQAQFRSGKWTGELNSYIVTPGTGALQMPAEWSASTHASLSRIGTAWQLRNIQVPTGASTQSAFEWTNLTATQRTALGSAAMVDYLRGDSSNEETPMGGIYRARSSNLGDIVNSTPVYVGSPNANLYSGATFTGSGSYGAFVAARAGRQGMVYVGGNDGMLHAFNATNGGETYAFVPNRAITNSLIAISDPAYTHRYYVDGDMAIADVYGGTTAGWKTILIGTMGRGGPGVFALDITDPGNIQFLWERSGADISALGKNIGRPVIAQVANGDWRVLIGNGPESADGTAALITIDVFNGSFTEIQTDGTTGNGLSAVLARDTDGDGFADTAYGGDALGNLWKFTSISGAGSYSLLFAARDPTNPQPITAAPLVGRDPATAAIWVFFGTGSYLSDDDFISTQPQTWYGIKDTGTTVTRAQLLARPVVTTVPYSLGPLINDPSDDVLGQRTLTTGTAADLATYRGWYINLPSSRERMVVANRFQGGALVGTTRIPDPSDACDPSGSGFIMAINPFTGARLDRTFFDVNGDGLFNNADLLGGNVISGVGFNSSPNAPIFVEDVMQVSLDDGSTKTIRTQGSSVAAERLNWREIIN